VVEQDGAKRDEKAPENHPGGYVQCHGQMVYGRVFDGRRELETLRW
jgi:hypothetical protein